MLKIHEEARELFDERTYDFINVPECDLRLEHSLISLSRWESKWKIPFLTLENPSKDQMTDYICCMSMDKEIDPKVAQNLSVENYMKIRNYIADSQTATTITDRRPNTGKKREVYTSEVIYYWMIYYGIPFCCEKWPLNRLLTLIRVCGVKGGTTNQAMSMEAIFAQNNALNAARRGRSAHG